MNLKNIIAKVLAVVWPKPTLADCIPDEFTFTNATSPLTVEYTGKVGRVEIRGANRWVLDGNGGQVQRGETLRLVTGEPYTKVCSTWMRIASLHHLTANGDYEWRGDKDWLPSPLPKDYVGSVEIRTRLPLGIDGWATSFQIHPTVTSEY